jgi:2-polyprenyl-6-methoxyphenol hydroxylase-like FAD-dependent oxidoreductase
MADRGGDTKEPEVLIAGAGPVGLTLAIDLARRGVRCLVVERNESASELPKMERCNARTMEIFRRIGIAQRVRDAGLPGDVPMDVYITTRLVDDPILQLEYPSVEAHNATIRETQDGSEPLEPYQLVSQYVLEPLLRSIAEELEPATIRFGRELESFEQDADGVTALLRGADGSVEHVRARYLVGCDGGASTVRKGMGISLQGRGDIGTLRQVQFRCDELIERVPISGRGRHFCFADADPRIIGTTMVVQSDQRRFTFHTGLPADTDFVPVIQDKIGIPVDLEVLTVNEWKLHLLLAERYRDGRVFIAGDAAHLVIPQGGLGLNTGIGDATDLSWKLAGTLAGWGGPGLLDSYEIERRQVGERNIRASEYAAEGTAEWRKSSTDAVADDTPEGRAIRAEVAHSANIHHRKSHEMRGIELGYRYLGSPLIAYEAGDDDDGFSYTYSPSSRPGHRLPHMWLDDETALQDVVGDGYALLRLGGTTQDTGPLEEAFADMGVTLQVLERDEPALRAVYGSDLLLLRPDLHVAWSADVAPEDPAALVAATTGRAAALAPSA